MSHRGTYRQTGRQIKRQTDKETDSWADILTDRQTFRVKEIQSGEPTAEICKDRQTS